MLELRRRTLRTLAAWAAVALLVGVTALGAWYVPHTLREVRSLHEVKDRVAAEDALVKTVMQALGGAVVLVGLYFTSRTLQVSQQGQITDRFNDAIEHLGSEALAVRLGGIYALARIAADSERDAQTIVEILCSFVRVTVAKTPGPTAADVKAVLAVLGTAAWARESPKDLRGCIFRELDIERLDLRRSRMEDADFTRCRLARTRFDGAALRGAKFTDAYARDCSFAACDVTATDFDGAYLRNASFESADIFGAVFADASLLGASFRGAKNAVRPQFSAAVMDDTTVLPEFATVQGVRPGGAPLT